MMRSMFLAIGMYLILLSVQLYGVTEFHASWKKPKIVAQTASDSSPPHWDVTVTRFMPYSALCIGAVLCIYAHQIPKRIQEIREN